MKLLSSPASTLTATIALLCLILPAQAQLPNAWQITDESGASGSGVSYTNILNAALRTAATNAGFDFSVNARFVTDYGAGTNTMVMIYGDGRTRWEILWSLNTNGDLVSELITNISPVGFVTFPVTTNGTGKALYHTHEIIYNPSTKLASYLVDGQVLTANWAGSTPGNWSAGQVEWGAGSSAGVGVMNFHRVSFLITNSVVATYDAGMENNPNSAPAPQTQGWMNSPGILPSETRTNAISPDRGPGVVTTLADSDYGSLRQTLADARDGDTITFFTNGVITLTSGELLIMNNLTIGGSGPANLTLNGGGNSGIFEIASSNVVTLNSLTFTNGFSGDGGAIYLNSGGSLTVNNSTFSGNTATNNGGAIDNAGTLTLSNCVVTFNTALVGGGIFNEPDAMLTINDSILSRNSATNNGGAIDNAGTLTLSNCVVTANAAMVGGGIYDENGSTFTLNNSILSGNSAANGGGIENNNALLTVNNSILSVNSANNNGGGIDNDHGGATMLNNSTLSGNSAAYGGGVESYAATLMLTSCILSNNSASNNGGGMVNYAATLTLDNCTLSGNFANNSGGGIDNNGALLTVTNSILSDNSASTGGGIFNENGSTLLFNGSTLSGNSADYGGGIENNAAMLALNNSMLSGNSANDNGGGIDNDYGGTVALTNCTLSGNSAASGGGIENYAATLTLNNTVLSGNSAADYGGGIDNEAGGAVMLLNSTLTSDSAGGGGGVENNNAVFTLNHTVLSGNSAIYYGGGGIDNNHGGTVTLNNSTLSGNSAPGYYGGGIQNGDGLLTLNGSTFSGNSAGYGGGIYNEYGSTNVLNNSTFSGNSAYDGGGLANSGTIKLNNCTFAGNFATYVNGGIYQDTGTSVLTNTIVAGNTANGSPNVSGAFSGANNLTTGYPLLAPLDNFGGPTRTMPPLHGSPAIDAGRDSVTNLLAADQRGYLRKAGAHVDIGAVEAQLTPANNPPSLKDAAWFGGGGTNGFQFAFTNIPNADFTVLASTNVAAPMNQWTILGLTMQSSPGQYQFIDPGATNYPQRFYRVVSP